MGRASHTTVLFADLGGSALSDAAERSLERLRDAAESAGGRVLNRTGDEVMVLFATPDEAVTAALRMHDLAAVHVGFHTGLLVLDDPQSAGDTVSLALCLAGQAGLGQTVTSEETAEQLGPRFRGHSRALYSMGVGVRGGSVRVCEVGYFRRSRHSR